MKTIWLGTLLFVTTSALVAGCDSNSSKDVGPARAATEFLAEQMDRYHDRVVVYEDVSSAGNHFVALGKIPDANAPVDINGSWSSNPRSGATAIRCEFTSTNAGFGGYYFMNGILPSGATSPQVNFGEVPDAGFDLSGATELTFWARGEEGGEEVDFFVAGVGRDADSGNPTTEYPGSSPRHPSHSAPLRPALTREWQQYTIDVSDLDLSYVLGGFAWVANSEDNPEGAVFYIDDIEYALSPDAREDRLDQPRFLLSFVTLPVQPDPFDADSTDDIDFVLRNLAFSYDNALVLLAFLAEGSPDSVDRARLIGNAFVYATEHDRFFNDGRIRTAYAAGDIALPPGWTPNGRPDTVPIPGFFSEEQQTFFEVEQESVDVGNNAWTMIALLALHKETEDPSYLDTARRIGSFIRSFRNDQGTYQGFKGGLKDPEGAAPMPREWASTEHNIDVYAAFRAIADIPGEPGWSDGAAHARIFVEAMWDETQECFLTGTVDPSSLNTRLHQLPVDAQAWSLLGAIPLALANQNAVLGCAETHHRTSHGGYSGFDFNDDRDGVWFEGTGQMALAYALADRTTVAEDLMVELRRAQNTLPYGNGRGLSAATRDGLTTGFGFAYYQRLHIAATSWFIFSELCFNPYSQEEVL